METFVPQGFSLAVASAGFKTPGRKDLAFVISSTPAVTSGLFTKNLFKAAPVIVGMDLINKRETGRAVVVNTGQANACTGDKGVENCLETLKMIGNAFDIDPEDILPASTGVIGAQLKMECFEAAIPDLVKNNGNVRPEDFAKAIMTTDSFPKYASSKVNIQGKPVILTGFAKGAGMICPNMATMISVVLCDAYVDKKTWRMMFSRAVERTFNRATVDGDTSTNDTLYGLANGASGVSVSGQDIGILEVALIDILNQLAYKLVQDGEGATKVLHINVSGAETDIVAEQAARTVGHSPLVKTAMYGKDANWGRIVAALGRSGVNFNPSDVRVSLCGVLLFENEQPSSLNFDELLKAPLEERDIYIDISLGNGHGSYELLASDFSHEYVNINADYRT